MKSCGRVRPALIVLLAVATVIALATAVSYFGIALSKRVTDRRAEKASLSDFAKQAEDVLEGKSRSVNTRYPDTPAGRMMRIMTEMIQESLASETKLGEDMEKVGWDWVLSPESLSNRKNLDESLKRLSAVRKLTLEYYDTLEKAVAEMIAAMKEESKKGRAASDFFKGAQKAIERPGSGLYYARQMKSHTLANFDGIEKMLMFLKARTGEYTLTPDGLIDFKASVTREERARYDAIVAKVDASAEALMKADEMRRKVANQRLSEAKERLR